MYFLETLPDYSGVKAVLFLILIIMAAIAGFKILTPYMKGFSGEKALSRYLSKLPRRKYKILNDVILQTAGASVQIDHIVVSEYGIFVIENKNYSGTITGSEKSEKWIQQIGEKEYEFMNPVKQNQIHINMIKSIIGSEFPIISVIAFSPKGRINAETSSFTVEYKMVNDVIKQHCEKIIDKSDVEKICAIILKENKSSFKNHVKHTVYVEKSRKNNNKYGKCPLCGKNLIKRKGKYGEFIGCSGYPECKFTKNIK